MTPAAVIQCRLVQSLVNWLYMVTIWYDGEPFDYTYDAGSVMYSERSAKAGVERQGFRLKAMSAFLRDVTLETPH